MQRGTGSHHRRSVPVLWLGSLTRGLLRIATTVHRSSKAPGAGKHTIDSAMRCFTGRGKAGVCQDTLSLKIRTSTAEQYSRSPKNPALQLLQKSSKSASTTPSQQWRKTVRPRRDRFGTIPQKLEFEIFGKTVLMEVLW